MKEKTKKSDLKVNWDAEFDLAGLTNKGYNERLKELIALEIDDFRNQSWWRRLLNKKHL